MIIIRASMKAKPGKRDEAVAALKAVMAGSQAEPGCKAYQFTADLTDPAIFHLVEMWDDEPSLLAHFDGAAFHGFRAVAGDIVEGSGMEAFTGDVAPYQIPMPA